jgi:hypothetical protein
MVQWYANTNDIRIRGHIFLIPMQSNYREYWILHL